MPAKKGSRLDPATGMKACASCRESKPAAAFQVNRSRKDGLFLYCRPCSSARGKSLYSKHGERWRESGRQKAAEAREEGLKHGPKTFPETKRCSMCKETRHRSQFNTVPANRKHGLSSGCRPCLSAKKKAKRASPIEAQAFRDAVARRQALLDAAPGGKFDVNRVDYKARAALYGDACWCCRGPYVTFDHSIPLTVGGTNWAANMRPVCKSCNGARSGRSLGEFLNLLVKFRPEHPFNNQPARLPLP